MVGGNGRTAAGLGVAHLCQVLLLAKRGGRLEGSQRSGVKIGVSNHGSTTPWRIHQLLHYYKVGKKVMKKTYDS